MVDLPSTPNEIPQLRAPTSRVSPGQIAQPYQELADSFGKASDVLNDVAKRAAKEQAGNDLLNQKVTRNADGSVNVENPASAPLLFGDAATVYHDAVKSGTLAQMGNDLSQQFTELHQKYALDPQGFKTASDAYLAKRAATNGGQIGEAIQREGAHLQTEHFNSITNATASNDVQTQKTSLLSQIDDQTNTAIALARQGGTSTPEFARAAAKINSAYDALGTNPLFSMPQDQIDIKKKNTAALLQGEAVVSNVDATFKRKDGGNLAQEQLNTDILNNPNLREADRSRLYTQGLSRLAYLTGSAKADIDANRKTVTEMESTLASGKLRAEDPVVAIAAQRAIDIGDTESAQRISAAAAIQQHLRAVNPLPDAIKAEVLGVPGQAGNGPVNLSIPPEGRALLKTIGSTESSNRYNVRYAGTGDKTFQGFGDHPRIAEPITSGPDVGKTSSAAGYYQFIGSTWDQQKQKLGLSDFSPANQDTAAWDLAQTTYKQKTGKDLLSTLKSGDTADVLPALSSQWSSLPGGRQPASRFMAPSANGGPGFTAEDVQRNPFLLSAYVRTLAADPEFRVQAAKQTAAAVGKALDLGVLPPPSGVAEVNQAYELYPEKMGAVADEMNGRLLGNEIAKQPQEQQTQLIESYKRASDGQDVHHINVAAAAQKQLDGQNANMEKNPHAEAATRGWVSDPMPIDPSQPDTIAPALVQRAGQSERIAALNHAPKPSLFDQADMPKLQAALQGPNGPAVLTSIAQSLKPEEMQPLLEEKEFRSSVTGMSRSGDPAKMNAAYSFMDTQQKANPLQFDKQFPDGLKDLRAWQSNLSFYPPEDAAKRLMQSYDPAQSAALKANEVVAHKALETVSADSVVSKFSTGFGPIGVGARSPVGVDVGVAKGALKADYDKNYKDGFAATGDATMADTFAVEKLNLKYAVSPTNGNRVMANAPERYYPQVGGSHDWMKMQLDDAVAKSAGVDKSLPDLSSGKGGLFGTVDINEPADTGLPGERRYAAPRAIVSDAMTDRDIASGKPPSYQVILQDANGRWAAMTGADLKVQRFRFDPSAPFAERATKMEARRAAMPEPFSGVQP